MAGKFKLITGLGLVDVKKAENIALIWAHAGVDIIDSSCEVMPDIQKTLIANGFLLEDFDFCVSVSILGDVHGKKAKIDPNKCVLCEKCKNSCIEKAINPPFIKKEICIGCAKCQKSCPNGAISLYDNCFLNIENFANFIKSGAKLDTLEIHICVEDENLIINDFKNYLALIKDKKCKISVCLSRKYFSNSKVENILSKLKKLCLAHDFIVQADGNSMNGGQNSIKSTLEAVCFGLFCAGLGYEVILSGGTNEYTAKLAKKAGFSPCIAYGSFARKLISGYDFKTAVKIASKFVKKTKELIND